MSREHSAEPWRLGSNGDSVVCDSGERLKFKMDAESLKHYGGYLVCESVCDADARRIVACVNACVGITTDELEMLARAGKRVLAHPPPRRRRPAHRRAPYSVDKCVCGADWPHVPTVKP